MAPATESMQRAIMVSTSPFGMKAEPKETAMRKARKKTLRCFHLVSKTANKIPKQKKMIGKKFDGANFPSAKFIKNLTRFPVCIFE